MSKIAVPLAAINPGELRVTAVTRGQPDAQLSAPTCGDWADSQADSAGSIPVTRSNGEGPASGQESWCWALIDHDVLLE
jgi:hypothetical protein